MTLNKQIRLYKTERQGHFGEDRIYKNTAGLELDQMYKLVYACMERLNLSIGKDEWMPHSKADLEERYAALNKGHQLMCLRNVLRQKVHADDVKAVMEELHLVAQPKAKKEKTPKAPPAPKLEKAAPPAKTGAKRESVRKPKQAKTGAKRPAAAAASLK